MKGALTFGLGIFVCSLVAGQVEHLIRTQEFGPVIARLPGFLICSVIGWLFYTLGSAIFKRSVSTLVAFASGVVAMLIESAVMANFYARTTLNVDNRNDLINSPSGELLSACVQLILPVAVVAFLTPALGHRKN